MEDVVSSMGFEEFLDDYLRQPGNLRDRKRGNSQANYGLAGGKCLASPKTLKDVLENFVAYPNVLTGTLDGQGCLFPLQRLRLEAAARAGKALGIDYCQDDFVSKNPSHAAHFDYLDKRFKHKGTIFAAWTIAILPLTADRRVERHVDSENDPTLSAVLNITRVYCREGTYYRMCGIFYQRKSCPDFHKRQRATAELCNCFKQFLINTKSELYRRPLCPADTYLKEGIGSDGAIAVFDKHDGVIVGFALKSKPSGDKQGKFIPATVTSIEGLISLKKLALRTEGVELLLVASLCCSQFLLSVVLGHMQSDWDRSISDNLPGSLVEYVIQEMIRMGGSFNAGPCRRSLCSTNKPILLHKLRDAVKTLSQLLRYRNKLAESDQLVASRKLIRDVAKCPHLGTFSATALVHVAAAIGLVHSDHLCHAVINGDTSRSTPCLDLYVGKNAKGTKEDPYTSKSTKEARYDNVLDWGLQWSRAAMQLVQEDNRPTTRSITAEANNGSLVESTKASLNIDPNLNANTSKLTRSMLENCGCEGGRSPNSKAADIFVPGGHFSCYEGDRWVRYQPYRDGENNVQIQRYEMDEFVSSSERFHMNPRTWTGGKLWCEMDEEDPMKQYTVKVGSVENDKNDRYQFVTLGRDDLGTAMTRCILGKMCSDSPKKPVVYKDCMRELNEIPGLTGIVARIAKETAKPSKSGKKRKSSEAKFSKNNKTSKTLPDPVVMPKPWDSPAPKSTGWCNATSRILPGEYKLEVRVFSFKNQLDGTVMDRWMTYDSKSDFSVHSRTENYVLINAANQALQLCESNKRGINIPRLKASMSQSKKSPGKTNVQIVKMQQGNSAMHRVFLDFIPTEFLGEAGKCLLQDAIASAIGGVQILDVSVGKKFWFFADKDDAHNFLYLSIVCKCGSTAYYTKLLNKTRKVSAEINSVKQDESVNTNSVHLCVAGYSGTKGGTTLYYVIGRWCKENESRSLAMAIPNKSKNGRKTQNTYIRLL